MPASIKKLNVFIFIVFLTMILSLFIPATVWAQENDEAEITEESQPPVEDKLSAEVTYDEVMNFGSEGTAFDYKIDLAFESEEDMYFDFEYELAQGWDIEIQPQTAAVNISTVKLKPGKTESLKVILKPEVKQQPGEYESIITVKSSEKNPELSASVTLKSIVQPSGELDIKTESGLLNTEIVKNKDNSFTLILSNTGSGPVENTNLSVSGAPVKWLIDFSEDLITKIEPGQSVNIEMKVLPDEKTIAGDYIINVNARSDKSSDSIDIRTTIKVPVSWQIAGIALIVIVVAGIAVMFYRMARR